jgi:hypothetical protein
VVLLYKSVKNIQDKVRLDLYSSDMDTLMDNLFSRVITTERGEKDRIFQNTCIQNASMNGSSSILDIVAKYHGNLYEIRLEASTEPVVIVPFPSPRFVKSPFELGYRNVHLSMEADPTKEPSDADNWLLAENLRRSFEDYEDIHQYEGKPSMVLQIAGVLQALNGNPT